MAELTTDRGIPPAEADVENESGCSEYDAEVAAARRQILDRDLAGAGARLHRGASLDLRRPEVFNLLGVIEYVRGRRLDALRWWRVALLLDGSYRPSLDNLERTVRHQWPPGGLELG